MRKTSLFLLVWLASCGGAASDNPPDISGTYDCTVNCFGTCDYSNDIEITQDGDRFSASGDNGTGVGTVDNEGYIEFSSGTSEGASTSCDGWFISDGITIQCSGGGTECQEARFERR